MYDPQLGRWHRKDPLMEWHFNYSPYAYCYDNPVGYIDPNGMDASPGFQDEWNGDITRRRKPKPDPVFPGYQIDPVTVTYYIKKPEKKGFWGFMFFGDGYSDGSESTARPVSWDRVLGFIDISFLQDMFDAFWRGKELHKKIKDTDEKMAGKGIKRALQTPDKDMNPNNTTNADGEEIDDQGQPTNRIIHIEPGEVKSLNRRHKTITIYRDDSVIHKIVNSPGDTNTLKWINDHKIY
jgi:hypothetical protein